MSANREYGEAENQATRVNHHLVVRGFAEISFPLIEDDLEIVRLPVEPDFHFSFAHS